MSEEMLAVMREEIGKSIQVHVNGKIDRIHAILEKQNEKQEEFNKKVDTHIQTVEPYLQGALGLGVLWKFLVAIGVGMVAIKAGILR